MIFLTDFLDFISGDGSSLGFELSSRAHLLNFRSELLIIFLNGPVIDTLCSPMHVNNVESECDKTV